jgi:hypothetical protein
VSGIGSKSALHTARVAGTGLNPNFYVVSVLAGLKTGFPSLNSGAGTKFGYGLQIKTFPRMSIHTEISPLRYASVDMTKGRTVLPRRVVDK